MPTLPTLTLTLNYGTLEITGFEGPWRREIYHPFEVSPHEPWNAAVVERTMVVDHKDMSTRHDKCTYYDSRCSCCYLNITHSVNKHAEEI